MKPNKPMIRPSGHSASRAMPHSPPARMKPHAPGGGNRFRAGLGLVKLPLLLVLSFLFSFFAQAAVPDLTNGGVPDDSKTLNLGPTGMKGWLYSWKSDTSSSRQILVKVVEAGSPADGILAVDDVILGVSGTAAAPANFSSDAWRSLGDAITDAEANDPAILKVIRWRAGATTTVSVPLEFLGAYSSNAPYGCQKSELILERGLQHVMANQDAGRFSLGTLALLAANDPNNPDNAARLARAEAEALALIPSAGAMAGMMDDKVDTGSKIAWNRGHTLIVLAEYYLATGDARVLDAIEAYAVSIAVGQSQFGTVGHAFVARYDAVGTGLIGGYGSVNSAAVPCALGLVLARECGVTDPRVIKGIEDGARYFGGYAGRGAIPYGEGPARYIEHESNGKSGAAALLFALHDDKPEAAEFFAQMAAASASERYVGHLGSYFNQLWAPLGANVGGEELAAAHFQTVRHTLELSRRWDGDFAYNHFNSGPTTGSNEYNQMYMSTAALLTYAMPLRQLHISGRDQNSDLWHSSSEATEVVAADGYDPSSRLDSELVADLGSWSPKVRNQAATELGDRAPGTAALVPDLIAMTNGTDRNSRAGACLALGHIGDASGAAPLVQLMEDSDGYVRWAAAEAMRYMPDATKLSHANAILAAVDAIKRPVYPLDEVDPLQFDLEAMSTLLFYSGNAYPPRGIFKDGVEGVDKNLLFPAVRVLSSHPSGRARQHLVLAYDALNQNDVSELADTVVDATRTEAIADTRWALHIRKAGLRALERTDFSEGVPLAKAYYESTGSAGPALSRLEAYASSVLTVQPDPDIVGFAERLLDLRIEPEAAQEVLDAIANDPNPRVITPFKSIQSVTAAASSLNLPARSTTISVDSEDLAKGDSIYTWRKIHGAGDVFFTPNGTGDAKDVTVLFEGDPGQYLLEVTMSDSRGLTEVSETLAITLNDSSGSLPPNDPPTAIAESVTLPQATAVPITLGATDPEGYELTYSVVSQPSHGRLTGTAPFLIYTSDFNYTGADSFNFQAMDSEGQVSVATIDITVNTATGFETALYEPFDYALGELDGQSGTSEVGLEGSWYAWRSNSVVTAGSQPYGSLRTNGGHISTDGTISGVAFGGSRSIGSASLAGNGLLNDGATVWLSAVMSTSNVTHGRLRLALANNRFENYRDGTYIQNEGTQPGSGIGFHLIPIGNVDGRFVASHFRDRSFGENGSGVLKGSWTGASPSLQANVPRLFVMRITWGATPEDDDVVELFLPGEDMVLPVSAASVLTTKVDQSTFDTLTWSRKQNILLDEIRIGATYKSVLLGTAPMTADFAAPAPDPAAFHVAPAASGVSSVTMAAVTAYDPSGVEYYFTNTSGNGNDSGWQTSPTYTDTGLTPGVGYSYTVSVRDRSPAQNAGAPSAAASVTLPTNVTVPDLSGMDLATAQAILAHYGLSVVVSEGYSSSIPEGAIASQSFGAGTLAPIGASVELVISLGPEPLPATVNWVAGSDGAWESPVNWQTNDTVPVNRVPTTGDVAAAGSGGHTITYSEASGTTTIGQVQFRSTNASADPVVMNQTGGILKVQQNGAGNGVFYIQNDGGLKSLPNYTISGGSLDLSRSLAMNTLNSNGDGSWFHQAGGDVSIGERITMNDRAKDMTSLYEMVGGTLTVTDGIRMNGRESGLLATFDQTGGDVVITSGQLKLGFGGTGTAVYRLASGSLTIRTAVNPITFGTSNGYFDFVGTGGTLNLKGTWDFASLTALANADFRADGIAAQPWDFSFEAITVDGADFTRITRVIDTTAPELAAAGIVDDRGGAPVDRGSGVNYTLSFSEDIDETTLEADDFSNAGTAAITIGSITKTSPGVFSVGVTPTAVGSLQLMVNAGAVITDLPGNPLDTTSAISDDTVITVDPMLLTVPDVVGLSQASAEAAITTSGFTVGVVGTAYSSSVAAGDVISQDATPGSELAEGTAVSFTVSLGPDLSPKLVRTTVSSVSTSSWTTVDLGRAYNSLVVIATPIYPDDTMVPVVARITNVTASGFDVKIDRMDGLTDPVSVDVSIVAVDEGVYTQAIDGVTMEAVKFTSTVTANRYSWVAEARTYQNSYVNPVVIGQVMSANDANGSSFWSMGSSRTNPADASNLNVGKHVGEDRNTTRADETIGYIVIESGIGSIDGIAFEAGLGADSVRGLGDSATPYSYPLSGSLTTASAAALSIAARDGHDGGWAVLGGSPAFSPSSIQMWIDEDTLKDNERKHTTEQVGYIVFE